VTTIRVQLRGDGSDRSYDVACGSGLLPTVGRIVAADGGRRAVVITDTAVASSHAAAVVASLRAAGV
jgi:3-dehydroquinate synthetase